LVVSPDLVDAGHVRRVARRARDGRPGPARWQHGDSRARVAAGPRSGGLCDRHWTRSSAHRPARRRGGRVHSHPHRLRRGRGRPQGLMPRWLAHLLVVVGWLLTPLWAWGASYLGLWLGALVALRFSSPLAMLVVAGLGAVLVGFVVLWAWVRFMRRLPHLLSHLMAPRASE